VNRRVVITGLGLVTPLGIGVAETWQALCAGKSGIGKITRFDVTPYNTKIAGQVKTPGAARLDPLQMLAAQRSRLMQAALDHPVAGQQGGRDGHRRGVTR